MHATRAAVEEGIVPGGGVALLRASEQLKGLRTKNDDQKTGVEIVRKALSWPARQIAINAGEDGSVIVGKILEKESVCLRLRLADRRIRQPRQEGHHRPDQGGPCGDPERGLGRGSPDHHRSHGRRTAEEERRRRRRHAPGRRHGRHGFLIQPASRDHQEYKTPAAMPGFLFGGINATRRYFRSVGTCDQTSRSWLWNPGSALRAAPE